MRARPSTRLRWVRAMHVSNMRRLIPHVLAHRRDAQAAERLLAEMSYFDHPLRSPLWVASAGLTETRPFVPPKSLGVRAAVVSRP